MIGETVVVVVVVVVGATDDEVVDVDPIRGAVVVVEVPAELAGWVVDGDATVVTDDGAVVDGALVVEVDDGATEEVVEDGATVVVVVVVVVVVDVVDVVVVVVVVVVVDPAEMLPEPMIFPPEP